MDISQIKAKDIMVSDLITVKPTDKIGATDLRMIRAAIGGVPVVNGNNKLLGIITQRDIMLSRFTASITSSKVEDLMTREVIKCHPDTSIENILKMMLKNDVERIPVVNGDDHILGLIVHKNILESLYKSITNGAGDSN